MKLLTYIRLAAAFVALNIFTVALYYVAALSWPAVAMSFVGLAAIIAAAFIGWKNRKLGHNIADTLIVLGITISQLAPWRNVGDAIFLGVWIVLLGLNVAILVYALRRANLKPDTTFQQMIETPSLAR